MSTLYSTVKSRTEMTTVTSVGLMPTEARGNYLPEAPYLRKTKTYLNYMRVSESTLDSGTASHSSRHDIQQQTHTRRFFQDYPGEPVPER